MRPKSSKPPRVKSGSDEPAAVPSSIPSMWDDEVEVSHTDRTALVAPKSIRSAQRPALMVMAGSSAGKVLRIERTKVVVGRSKQVDFPLSDEGISRKHFEIDRAEGTGSYFLTDLGSTNGTLV